MWRIPGQCQTFHNADCVALQSVFASLESPALDNQRSGSASRSHQGKLHAGGGAGGLGAQVKASPERHWRQT